MFLLLLLLPILVLGQHPDQQKREEYNQFMGCVRNYTLFDRADGGVFTTSSENRALLDELNHVLECSKDFNHVSYFGENLRAITSLRKNMLNAYFKKFEKCAIALEESQIQPQCVIPDDDECIVESVTCLSETIQSVPGCQNVSVGDIQPQEWLIKLLCSVKEILRVALRNNGIDETNNISA